MSEDNSNGVSSSSPGQQNMIPKERFDELVQERRFLQEQITTLQEIARQAVPQRGPYQPAQVEEESATLRQLKEEQPSVYALIKQQQGALKQQQAASFVVMDEMDRMKFVNEFGEDAKKYIGQVEKELDSLRQRGISNFNRGQIYVHLKGQEAIRAPKQAATQSAPQAQATTTTQALNVPSSNPSSAATTSTSSASPNGGAKTLEDIEREIGDMLL